MIDTSAWFQPQIGSRLKPSIQFVFREWSHLADEELASHLHRIVGSAPTGLFHITITKWNNPI